MNYDLVNRLSHHHLLEYRTTTNQICKLNQRNYCVSQLNTIKKSKIEVLNFTLRAPAIYKKNKRANMFGLACEVHFKFLFQICEKTERERERKKREY